MYTLFFVILCFSSDTFFFSPLFVIFSLLGLRSSDQHAMGRRNIHRLRSEDAEGIDVPEPDRMSIDEDEFDNDPNESTEEVCFPFFSCI